MPTWSTRYVRLRDRSADLPRLQREIVGAEVHIDPRGTFAAIVVPAPSLQPDDLAALSRDFSEAFSIQVQSVADLVIYDHWRDGERARGLTFAGEAGWERVIGTPEPWEAPFFFAPARLEALLAELEEDCTDDAIRARDSAELKRLFAGGRLEEGNSRPLVQWRALSQEIERHYGLPSTAPAQSTRMPRSPKT